MLLKIHGCYQVRTKGLNLVPSSGFSFAPEREHRAETLGVEGIIGVHMGIAKIDLGWKIPPRVWRVARLANDISGIFGIGQQTDSSTVVLRRGNGG